MKDITEIDKQLTNTLLSILDYPIHDLRKNISMNLSNCTKNLLSSDSSPFEELISIIFQSKPLRYNGNAHGNIIRKTKGIFHTPYNVARVIAREALTPHTETIYRRIIYSKDLLLRKRLYNMLLTLKIIDPACGTGIILSAAVEHLCEVNDKLAKTLKNTEYYLPKKIFSTHIVHNNIFGVDIDPEACEVTRAILNSKYALKSKDISKNIKCGNSILPRNLFEKNTFLFQNNFSSVFKNRGGFDVLIMNPPYERLKTDKSDFHLIPKDKSLYYSNRSNVENIVGIIKKSKEFPLSSEGVLDLYKLFIDKATQITNDKGTISFIVPLTLLGDKSCKKIREYLYRKTHIYNIYCIPENARIFHNVSQAFCIIGVQKNVVRKEATTLYKDVSSISPLIYSTKFPINKTDIKSICPDTLSLPLTDKIGWNILKKLHRKKRIKEIDNIVNLRGEIDLTFGAKYLTNNPNDELLIRGNMVNAYGLNDKKSNKPCFIKAEALKDSKLIGSKHIYINTIRIVGQQISNMGLSKRLKFSLINKGFVANSCNFLTIKNNDKNYIFVLLGLLNSAILNWRFKLTSTNNHVNNYELDELPIALINNQNKLTYYKIAMLAKMQCGKYTTERQQEIDSLVSNLYELADNENNYIFKSLNI